MNKNILVIGSGLVSEPCIEYLLKSDDKNIITVISNNKLESERLFRNLISFLPRLNYYYCDIVLQTDILKNFVKKSDLIISLVPTFIQVHIVRACLDLNRSLLTTSYISEEIKKVSKKVKEKNLIFMFETGVNPGLDHVIASKVIREEEADGNVIIGYESWVGAVPSPESIDNPLLYKFSWDPKGALLTLKSDAKQLIQGKIVTITEQNLLTSYLVDKQFHESLNLEGYYNGNSLKYKDLYNLKHAKNVVRGIIRYQGFAFVIQCFKFLDLFSYNKPNQKDWKNYFLNILKNPRIQDNIYEVRNKYLKKNYLDIRVFNSNKEISQSEKMFYFNLSLLCISYFNDKYVRRFGFDNLFYRIYSVFTYLDLFSEDNKILSKDSMIDALAKLLEQRIIIKEDERDLVFMQNQFEIMKQDKSVVTKKYSLIVFGGHNRMPYTATSLLVGYPAAIVAQLMLDGKISERGVLIPNSDIIVEKTLEELKAIKINFEEKIEMRAKF